MECTCIELESTILDREKWCSRQRSEKGHKIHYQTRLLKIKKKKTESNASKKKKKRKEIGKYI